MPVLDSRVDDNVSTVHEWSVEYLQTRASSNAPVFLLDLRSPEEFSGWRIEAVGGGDSLNVHMADVLSSEGKDDPRRSFRSYSNKHLAGRLPRDVPIVVVCSRGIASVAAVSALRDSGYEAFALTGGMTAWANYYEFRAVIESAELSVYQCRRPARGCLSYIIASQGEAAIIDPLRHINEYQSFLGTHQLRPDLVLDTHGHADHISGGPRLSSVSAAPYYLHPYDALHPLDLVPGNLQFEYIRDGQVFSVGRSRITAMHIPGHTLGNTAFLVNDTLLLTGDSIFISSIARPDLGGRPESWAELHYHSLRRLMRCPEATLVLPGHFSHPSEADLDGLFLGRLGDLMRSNPGLQMAQKDIRTFTDYILKSLPHTMPEYVDIKRVNAGLLDVSEEMAMTFETGKNVCALGHKS